MKIFKIIHKIMDYVILRLMAVIKSLVKKTVSFKLVKKACFDQIFSKHAFLFALLLSFIKLI